MKNTRGVKRKKITAQAFDRKFERGENILQYLDFKKVTVVRRINVDFPDWMVKRLDSEAKKLNISRQAVIKTWVAEKIASCSHWRSSGNSGRIRNFLPRANAARVKGQISSIIHTETSPFFSLRGLNNIAADLLKKKAIEKFSLTGRQIIIYMDSIDAGQTFSFNYRLKAKFPIRAKSSASRVYEYYNPEDESFSAPISLQILWKVPALFYFLQTIVL